MPESLHEWPRPAERSGVPFAQLTTLRIGGPARRLVDAGGEQELVETVASADAAGEPLLVIGGGSNLVVSDDGFDGTVVRIAGRGVATAAAGRPAAPAGRPAPDGEGERVRVEVAAGEPWDELVARTVAENLAGIECLAGIPGLAGATPIQNVGAYGQQVSDTIVAVRAYDRQERSVVEMAAAECGFAYRSSAFRGSDRYVILSVTFELERSARARPLRYAELARSLGALPGDRPPLAQVRDAVLALRRGKGMVLDPDDPDSVSAGSFFVNPVLSEREFTALARRAGELGDPPRWPEPDGAVKTSAAWLIERAGFHRGFAQGRVAISGKHTLALVNRGGATTSEVLALARRIRDGVRETFGVGLLPEPTLVGASL